MWSSEVTHSVVLELPKIILIKYFMINMWQDLRRGTTLRWPSISPLFQVKVQLITFRISPVHSYSSFGYKRFNTVATTSIISRKQRINVHFQIKIPFLHILSTRVFHCVCSCKCEKEVSCYCRVYLPAERGPESLKLFIRYGKGWTRGGHGQTMSMHSFFLWAHAAKAQLGFINITRQTR